jgi:hypothetical protein
MKFSAIILCICISIVSATPCCFNDTGRDAGGYATTEQPAGDSGSHSHSHSHADANCSGVCSPFCLCGACGGFSVTLPVAGIQPVPQKFSKVNIFLPSLTYLSPSLEGVWQPPRY